MNQHEPTADNLILDEPETLNVGSDHAISQTETPPENVSSIIDSILESVERVEMLSIANETDTGLVSEELGDSDADVFVQDESSIQEEILVNESEEENTRTNPEVADNELARDPQSSHGIKQNDKHLSGGKKKQKSTPKPGTKLKSIDNSRPQQSLLDALTQALSDIQERHREMLPPSGASVKKAEKQSQRLVQLNHPLNTFRIILIALTALFLGSQRYTWMSLGFMSGEGGQYFSVLLLLFALVLNWHSVYKAFRGLLYLRFSFEALLILTSVFSALDVYQNKNPYSLLSVSTMAWCACGINDCRMETIKLKNYRAITGKRFSQSVRMASNSLNHQNCIARGPLNFHSAVRHQEEPDIWDTIYSVLGLAYFIIVFLVSTYVSSKMERNFLTVISLLMCASTPVAFVPSISKLYNNLTKSISSKGTLCGWYGIKQLAGKRTLLLTDFEIFPEKSLICRDVKKLANYSDTVVISYAASLAVSAEIGLNDVFNHLLEHMPYNLFQVRDCRADDGGAYGIIQGDRVYLGTSRYLDLNGVTVPTDNTSMSIFLAVNGILVAEFAMDYRKQRSTSKVFRSLVRENRLSILISAINPFITPQFIQNHYHVSMQRLQCPKYSKRRRISAKKIVSNSAICAYTRFDGLLTYCSVIRAARKLYRTGLIISIASVLLSLLIVLYYTQLLLHGVVIIAGPMVVILNLILALLLEIICRLISV